MAFEYLGANALDYGFCRYGNSGRVFRGPKAHTHGTYDVVIGGTETFGKFVEKPFPKILAGLTGTPTLNLGQMYSGADYFGDDREILALCNGARVTVVQLTGAQNMTNRFYSVHPRRNDRFLRPTKLLLDLYPDMDFTEFHFTGHLIGDLQALDPRRFEKILSGLRADWIDQMKSTIAGLPGSVILLWMAAHGPGLQKYLDGYSGDPMFINREMLDQTSKDASHLLEIVAMPEEIIAGQLRMFFNPTEEPAAEKMLGPIVHQEVARQLHEVLAAL